MLVSLSDPFFKGVIEMINLFLYCIIILLWDSGVAPLAAYKENCRSHRSHSTLWNDFHVLCFWEHIEAQCVLQHSFVHKNPYDMIYCSAPEMQQWTKRYENMYSVCEFIITTTRDFSHYIHMNFTAAYTALLKIVAFLFICVFVLTDGSSFSLDMHSCIWTF